MYVLSTQSKGQKKRKIKTEQQLIKLAHLLKETRERVKLDQQQPLFTTAPLGKQFTGFKHQRKGTNEAHFCLINLYFDGTTSKRIH